MREGGKKTLKNNIEPIFGKVIEGDERKNIGRISRKGNEGDEIKKTLILFEKKLTRASYKNKQKKRSWKNDFFIS